MWHLRPILALLSLFLLPCAAQAGDLYFETGVGVAQIRSGTALFGGSALTDTPTVGAGINLGLFYNLSAESADFQVHLGVQDRISASSDGGTQFVLHTPYLTGRAEFGHFYAGLGYTPFVFTREGGLVSFSYDPHGGSTAVMGHAGLLWKVVPYFNLALEAGLEYIRAQGIGSISPAPAGQLTIQMRFYLGFADASKGGGGSRKFDGWRYPFGIELGK